MQQPIFDRRVQPLNILIVGGGIAGLTFAMLLERKGHFVTIIEQSKEWKPVGGGMTLTLNGVRAIQGLGLLEDILPYANEIRNINIADQDGKLLSSFNLDGYAAAYARTYTVLRSRLHTTLVSRLQHTHVQTGTTFTSIENAGEQVRVVFSNGNEEYYDLVAGCDGINSSVRDHLFGNAAKKFAGYASWRFMAHGADAGDNNTITEMWGRGKRFGIVPLHGNMVHCFASVNCAGNSDSNRHISLDAFRALFADFGEPVQRLMKNIGNSDLVYNDLEDVHLDAWHKGRIVLVGDAAHGMTPNLTQGASMAIEDVCVLAAKLSDATGVEKDIAAYYKARRQRVGAIQKKSWLLGRIGQINNPVLCGLRNQCWKRIPDRWIQNDLKNLLVTDIPYQQTAV